MNVAAVQPVKLWPEQMMACWPFNGV